jgi:hypothetical protein
MLLLSLKLANLEATFNRMIMIPAKNLLLFKVTT